MKREKLAMKNKTIIGMAALVTFFVGFIALIIISAGHGYTTATPDLSNLTPINSINSSVNNSYEISNSYISYSVIDYTGTTTDYTIPTKKATLKGSTYNSHGDKI